jgi:hypothetical protein
MRCAILALTMALVLLAAMPASAQVLVDIANDQTDPDGNDDSEPSISVNPRNPLEIAVVAFSGNWSASAPAIVWKSNDGGATWRPVRQLPPPPTSPAQNGPNDQKIAFGADGRLLVAELDSDFSPPDCFVYRQTGTADAPLTAGASFGDDQPHIATDNGGGTFANRRYVAWLDTTPANARSMGAQSATDGLTIASVGAGDNSVNGNRTTRIAIGPDGSAYVVYKTREGNLAGGFENAHFRVARTDDGGGAWSGIGVAGVSVHGPAPVVTWFTDSFGNPAKGAVARARSSDAWIALNAANGDVWVVYCNRDASAFGQVYAVRSTTRGATWGTPVRVTDGTHHSAYPEIAVADNGTVGVLYIDFDDSGAQTIFRHRFARSFDGGATWRDTTLQSMNPATISNAADGWLWGDYEGLTAAGHTFYGAFCGASVGRTPVQLDPIFFKISAMQERADVFVRDWTDSVASADDGAEPSSHADFYSNSDVWNQLTSTASFNTADQPSHQPPNAGNGAAGDNFLFARVCRAAAGGAQNVTAHFMYSEFGVGSNFQDAGSPATSTITLPGSALMTTTAGHAWHLPPTTSSHLCLLVEISTPDDPIQPPSLLNHAPGWPTSDLNVRNDNNKAQRNSSVTHEAGEMKPGTHFAVVHNPASVTRDFLLSFQTTGSAPVTIATLGGGPHAEGTSGELAVRSLLPGENRWVAFTFATPPKERAQGVRVAQIEQGRPVNGFTIDVQPATLQEALTGNASARAELATRLGALFDNAAAKRNAVALRAIKRNAPIKTLTAAVTASNGALRKLIARVESDSRNDPFELHAAAARLDDAVKRGDAAAIAGADADLLARADAALTQRQKNGGDRADIVQTVAWQQTLFAAPALANIACAKELSARGNDFLTRFASSPPDATAYRTIVRDAATCVANITGQKIAPPAKSDPASLQGAHRAVLLRLMNR